MLQPLGKPDYQFLTKLNILVAYNLTIVSLGIYPKELKSYIHIHIQKKPCTRMLTHNYRTLKTIKMSFSEGINCDSSRLQNIVQP